MTRLLSAMVALSFLAGTPVVGEERAEYRAAWVTRFEWTDEDPEACRAKIIRAMEKVAAANLNAAVFQIRGEADTLYPSPLEPWSELLGGKDPGFDPVALAIEEAHKRGIEFHAYINAMPLRSRSYRRPPAAENHLWYQHGPESPEPWVCMDAEGRPAREEYYYLSPGIPGVHAYLRNVIMDVVRRYEVDGIHLDRIRFPGPGYIHDAVSERRFYGRGNPNRLDRADWQREQLDKLINDLAAEMREVRPECVFSCSAWGIYNRHNISGYGGFSSGYHDYYQDTWNWVRLGAMDVLMPMIYWNLSGPKPDYDELLKDFVGGVGGEHVVGGQRTFSAEENVAQVRVSREAEAAGTVLFSLGGAERRGVLKGLHETLYAAKAPTPKLSRVEKPQTGGILGTVRNPSGGPVADAWVSLVSVEGSRSRQRGVFGRTWTSSADGRFAFLNVPPGRVRVRVHYVGLAPVESEPLEVQAGQMVRAEVTLPVDEPALNIPFVQILAPRPGYETEAEVVHLLGRTSLDCKVRVGEKQVEVFRTGAFAADGLSLSPGENEIAVTVTDPAGRSHTETLKVVRQEPRPAVAVKELRVMEPAEDLALLPGDALSIRVAGPPGGKGFASCEGIASELPLVEEKGASGEPTGVYTAAMRVPDRPTTRPAAVRVSLEPPDSPSPLSATSRATVEVWDRLVVRVGEAREDGVGVTLGLHSVRLGGPYLTRLARGTRFEVVGRQGRNLKIALSKSMIGWAPQREVALLPEGTPLPHNYFTSCDIDGDERYDRITIALREKVAFAVRSATRPSNRLYIDFFNTHHALTWTSHKAGAQVVGPVTGEQIEEGLFRLTVPIDSKQIWGYWTEMDGQTLKLFIRRPPAIAASPDSPLKGLLFALEAGHGGSNFGAMGHMGTKEKTVNAAAVSALQKVLEARGAKTILVRPRDSSPSLRERADQASRAGADFFVSIHANSAGSGRGYLAISGTSTYYKDEHCHLPAELVYRQLLGLGWREFGVVGNFSYYPLQNTRVPGILVEQAFMSNPADEARLLDPAYQRDQAEAIARGLEEFFVAVRE